MSKRFEKRSLLGSGTFGKVYLAINKETGDQYAVKEVKVCGLSSKDVDQVMTEVSVLAYSRHVNIIRYKVAYMEKKTLNIVMEYADDGDLYQRIQTQRKLGQHLPEEVILDWFVQICSGIRYLHAKNILHRDLKTQNIFLTKNQTVKIGDFGISKILEHTTEYAKTAIGTPYYLSPEICQRLPYNQKSDVWAAGCVLYELACLTYPFEGSNFNELMVTIIHGRYKPVPDQYTSLVKDLVSVLLSSDTNQRPTCDQILCIPALKQYIDSYINHLQTTLPASPRPQPSKDKENIQNVNVTKPSKPRKHSLVTPRVRQPLAEKRSHSVNVETTEPNMKKMKPAAKPAPKCSLLRRAVSQRHHSENTNLNRSRSPLTIERDHNNNDVEMNEVFEDEKTDKTPEKSTMINSSTFNIDRNRKRERAKNESENESSVKTESENDVMKILYHYGLVGASAQTTSEGLRYFLEQRMGCDAFFRSYLKLKDALLCRNDYEKFKKCIEEAGRFWPILFHLVQLDSLPRKA